MTMLAHVALAALLFTADPGFDTVYLQNGGRIRGTVVEEDATRGVTIQVPGGQLRTVPPAEVFRIEYRDGTIGALGSAPKPPAPPQESAPPPAEVAPAPPAEAPAAPPAAPRHRRPPPPPGEPGWSGRPGYPSEPPPYQPPPYQPPPRYGPGRPQPFMLAAGLGFAIPSGDAERTIPMSDIVASQFLIELEGGLRFTPEVMGSLILDIGVGDAGPLARSFCPSSGDCTAATARFGVQLRYAFTPNALQTPWLAVGTAAEGTTSGGSNTFDRFEYDGWEYLRFSGGVDFRGTGQVGFGFFAGLSLSQYSHVKDPDPVLGGSFDLTSADRRSHTWVQAGVRVILFP